MEVREVLRQVSEWRETLESKMAEEERIPGTEDFQQTVDAISSQDKQSVRIQQLVGEKLSVLRQQIEGRGKKQSGRTPTGTSWNRKRTEVAAAEPGLDGRVRKYQEAIEEEDMLLSSLLMTLNSPPAFRLKLREKKRLSKDVSSQTCRQHPERRIRDTAILIGRPVQRGLLNVNPTDQRRVTKERKSRRAFEKSPVEDVHLTLQVSCAFREFDYFLQRCKSRSKSEKSLRVALDNDTSQKNILDLSQNVGKGRTLVDRSVQSTACGEGPEADQEPSTSVPVEKSVQTDPVGGKKSVQVQARVSKEEVDVASQTERLVMGLDKSVQSECQESVEKSIQVKTQVEDKFVQAKIELVEKSAQAGIEVEEKSVQTVLRGPLWLDSKSLQTDPEGGEKVAKSVQTESGLDQGGGLKDCCVQTESDDQREEGQAELGDLIAEGQSELIGGSEDEVLEAAGRRMESDHSDGDPGRTQLSDKSDGREEELTSEGQDSLAKEVVTLVAGQTDRSSVTPSSLSSSSNFSRVTLTTSDTMSEGEIKIKNKVWDLSEGEIPLESSSFL